MKEEELLLVYEPAHAEEVSSHTATTVVALDFWTERALVEKGVTYESSESYAPSPEESDSLFTKAQAIAKEWYRIPQMDFLAYRGIRIAEALEVNFDNYLQFALHRIYVIERILAAHPEVRKITVPYSKERVAPGSAPLTAFQLNGIVDIVMFIAKQRGIEVSVVGEPIPTDAIQPFPIQNWRHAAFIHFYNALLSLLPRKRTAIFASEYWSHIASTIERMNDTGLVMMDKSEIRNIPWRELIAHRMRFRHPMSETNGRIRAQAKREQEVFSAQWSTARPLVGALPQFVRSGTSWWPIVERAFDFIVETYSERVVADMLAIEHILQSERPSLVLLRASVSAQHHFFVIAHIAQHLGIPSIEIQHAGAVLDPRSVHARLEATYLAAYGPLTCIEYVRSQHCDPSRLRAIGSARFDYYHSTLPVSSGERAERVRALRLDPNRPVVLIVVPKEGMAQKLSPWHPTSYDVAALIRACAHARTAMPEIQFIFKFRRKGCWDCHRAYIHELFPDGSAAISEEDLFSEILISDMVASSMSTALYETMIARKPLVLFPWKPDRYHVPIYEKIAPILRSETEFADELARFLRDPEFRNARIESQNRFLSENYLFDGHSAERLERLIHELVAEPANAT